MTHHGGHDPCDAACQKLLLDSAMAAAAAGFYQRVIQNVDGLAKADIEVPQLFIDAEEAFLESALFLNENKQHLPDGAWDALMVNANNNCYRASEYLIPWAKMSAITPAMVDAWTATIFGWIQADQDFFVPLLNELAGVKVD